MKTSVLSAKNPKSIEKAVSFLKKGELVAIPTETVYGLAGLFSNTEAKKKIYSVKSRPLDNPLIAHVSSIQEAYDWIENPSDYQKDLELLAPFFPGPLTVIFKTHSKMDPEVHAAKTIAFRVPKHFWTLSLLKELKEPLFAPSANLSTKPSPTQIEHVLEDLSQKIPLAIDAGPTNIGIESTVLDLSAEEPLILRPGFITKAMLEKALKKTVNYAPFLSDKSPGNKYRHYAPKAALSLVEEDGWKKACPETTLFLSYKTPFKPFFEAFSEKNLYSLFRKADKLGKKLVCIRLDRTLLKKYALMNRIEKASKSSG